MQSRTLGSICFLFLTISCGEPSDSRVIPGNDCSSQACGPKLVTVWSAQAEAILLEKLGGPYAEGAAAPGLYLEREEMTESQLQALEQWSVQSNASTLGCTSPDEDLAYKATIFDSKGETYVFWGTHQGCGHPMREGQYVPIAYFQNFPGDIPYRPESAGDYAIEKVTINQHILKIDVRHKEGCASFRNFNLMLDSEVSESKPSIINGYLRYRTDNDCEKSRLTRLEFDLIQHDTHNAGSLRLKDWPKRIVLPGQH
jgi:hypothetical protein